MNKGQTPPAADGGLPGPPLEQVKEAAHRLIRGAWRRDGERLTDGDRPRFSIPCRPDYDDDMILTDWINAQSALMTELRDQAHYANGVAELAMKHRDEAEAQLAAATTRLASAEAVIAQAAEAMRTGYNEDLAVSAARAWLTSKDGEKHNG